MASAINTSRSTLGWLHNNEDLLVTLKTLDLKATILSKQLQIQLVDASPPEKQ